MKKKQNKPTKSEVNLLESSEALAEKLSKTEHFIEKNKRTLLVSGSIIVVLIAAFFFYKYFIMEQESEAQREMFQAVYYFEADSLDNALNGDGYNLGFLDIIDDYPMTKSANLSNFYAGVCYLKQQEYESAIEHLSDFSSKDLLVQARAYSLIGDAYMQLSLFEDAVKHYKKAIKHQPNSVTTPRYWVKTALAHEQLNDLTSAIECYNAIISDYPKSTEYNDAKREKARLEELKNI